MKKTVLLSLGLMMSCGSVAAWAQQSFPKMTVANDTVWYVLSTPERDNLHLTCAGEGDYVTGSAATYANSQMWCFVVSPNGQLNMLNRQAGLYLSEKAAADKYFRSTASAPETGFKLQLVESKNLYNLIDASGQMVNQCLNTEQFRLTNWEQSTDPGNLFQIEEVDVDNVALSVARNEARTLLSQTEAGTAPGTYPQASRDKLEAAIEQAQTVEELQAAMTEYRQSMAGVTEGQFYFLVSTGPSYCNGKGGLQHQTHRRGLASLGRQDY